MEDHTYYLAQEKGSKYESSLSRSENMKENLIQNRRWQKTRMNIGVAFPMEIADSFS